MKLLPYHRFDFCSPMKPADALAALAPHVEPVKMWRMRWPSNKNDRRFQGQVDADGFAIRRVIGYRNSFLPQVVGKISAEGAGARVEIVMQPIVFVAIFMAIWLALAFGAGAVALSAGEGPAIAIAAGLILFGYVMVMAGFWFEAVKQEAVLRDIFKAAAI